jgi:hypothetical protein
MKLSQAIDQLDKIASMVRKSNTGFVEEGYWNRTLEDSEALVREFKAKYAKSDSQMACDVVN